MTHVLRIMFKAKIHKRLKKTRTFRTIPILNWCLVIQIGIK